MTNELSNFRIFVQSKYMEHKDECRWYRIPCKYQSFSRYFHKNKWFLKKMWKSESTI
jgi:hypothetical protein